MNELGQRGPVPVQSGEKNKMRDKVRNSQLGDFVQFVYGKGLPARDRNPGAVPVYGSGGVVDTHDQSLVRGPGVVVGRKGTIGSVYWTDRDFYPIDTTYYVVPKTEDTRLRYIYYLLKTLPLARMNTDAAVPGLNRSNALRLEVSIPSPSTQDRIVDILSPYDDLIENNRRRIQLLEQAARLIYKEWFIHLRFPGYEDVKIIDGVPEGWQKKKIAEVCETIGGGTPSTKVAQYWGGDITWVIPSDVTKNDCLALLDSERKITETGLRKSSAQLVPANTILMTSRASVGFFALVDVEACTNQGFINIIPHAEEMRMYLLFNLMSRVAEIRNNAKGTTYPEISKGRFRQMDIILPTESLISEFGRLAGDFIRQVRCLKREMVKLAQARDLLLPRLMNGEVAV